jgi:hypothetical protein
MLPSPRLISNVGELADTRVDPVHRERWLDTSLSPIRNALSAIFLQLPVGKSGEKKIAARAIFERSSLQEQVYAKAYSNHDTIS